MPDLSGKKILIVRLGKIGDIIITSSVFNVLKNKYPGIEISLLTLARNRDVLKYNPDIDRVYFTNKNLSLYFLLLKLRKYKFDFLLDLNDDPSRTSGTIRKILKTGSTAGFEFGISPAPDISVVQPSKKTTHIIDRISFLLNGIGLDTGAQRLKPVLYPGKNEMSDVANQLKKYSPEFGVIAVNLSAGAPIRYWPEEKWLELLFRIVKECPGYKLLLLSTKDDILIKKNIAEKLPQSFIIPQLFDSFQHYASYICNANLLITVDTAAVHIASAFNIPQLVLFPSVEWNFVSWQPLSDISLSIRSKEEELSAIPVDEVWGSFEIIIKKLEKIKGS